METTIFKNSFYFLVLLALYVFGSTVNHVPQHNSPLPNTLHLLLQMHTRRPGLGFASPLGLVLWYSWLLSKHGSELKFPALLLMTCPLMPSKAL